MKKKILATILAMTMIMTMVMVVPSVSAEELEYEGLLYTVDEEDNVTITGVSDEMRANGDFDLMFPFDIDGKPVLYISDYAFCETSIGTEGRLKFVIFSPNIKKIGTGAFLDCTELRGDLSLLSIEEMGDECFKNTPKLQSIMITGPVESIPDYFCQNSGITGVSLLGTTKSIGVSAFQDCVNLQRVSFSDSIVEIKENAFKGCSSLGQCWLARNLEILGNSAFEGCSSLTGLVIPKTLKSYEGTSQFKDCTSLISASIDSSTDYIPAHIFDGCTKLNNILISDSLKNISPYAFYNCSNLEGRFVKMSNNIESIGEYAFYGCSNLDLIYIPASVTTIEPFAFGGEGKLSLHGEDKSAIQTFAAENNLSFKIGEPDYDSVSHILGDVDGDKNVTVSDVVALRIAIMKNEYNVLGDVDYDGALTVSDVVTLRRRIMFC